MTMKYIRAAPRRAAPTADRVQVRSFFTLCPAGRPVQSLFAIGRVVRKGVRKVSNSRIVIPA